MADSKEEELCGVERVILLAPWPEKYRLFLPLSGETFTTTYYYYYYYGSSERNLLHSLGELMQCQLAVVMLCKRGTLFRENLNYKIECLYPTQHNKAHLSDLTLQ